MTLNRAKGRMFKSVGWTWNPIAGCSHNCKYCWAESLMKRWGKTFEPQIREHFFKDKMPDDGSWIFVGSMGDVFCDSVPDEWIVKLLEYIKTCKTNNKFLLQTKNPKRFIDFLFQLHEIKDKVVLGTTLETTEEITWSKAPPTHERANALAQLKMAGYKTFLSLEPISYFKLFEMQSWIQLIAPEAVEIGLENYGNYTIKPPVQLLRFLINWLDKEGYTVILKENLDYLSNSLDRKRIYKGEEQ